MSTMAEVLAAHHDWEYRKNLGYYRSEYACQCGATFWGGDHDEDPSMMEARAEHVADALTKAGYGNLADAFPIIRDLADPEDCWFDHHGGCQAHGYLSLQPGETCPHHDAKEWLKANEGSAS